MKMLWRENKDEQCIDSVLKLRHYTRITTVQSKSLTRGTSATCHDRRTHIRIILPP